MAAAGDCEFTKGKDLGANSKPYFYNVKTAGSGFVSNFRTARSSILRRASLFIMPQEASQQYIGARKNSLLARRELSKGFELRRCSILTGEILTTLREVAFCVFARGGTFGRYQEGWSVMCL